MENQGVTCGLQHTWIEPSNDPKNAFQLLIEEIKVIWERIEKWTESTSY